MKFSVSTLGLLLVLCVTQVHAQDKKSPPRKTQQVAPANASLPMQALNDIAKTAASYGVRDCLPRISQVTNFLVGTAQNGATLFLSPDHTNRVLEGLSLEVVGVDGNVSYVSTSFAPGPQPEQCSATYDSVTYWNNTCEDLANRVFTAFSRGKPLHRYIISLEDGPLVRVFLMRAGSGCVAIKKETIYPSS